MKLEWRVLIQSLEQLYRHIEYQELRQQEIVSQWKNEWTDLDQLITAHFEGSQ